MMILVVVDANIILSALLGGKPSIILFDGRFQFATAEFTIKEVKKYLPKIEKKVGISEKELSSLLDDLPLEVHKREFYKDKLNLSEKLIGLIDKKDADILALALKLENFLWSEDKHFDKSGYPKILKTYNFL